MSTTLDRKIVSGGFLMGPTDPADVFAPERFGEEPRMLAAEVERFVRERVLPRWEALDAQEEGLLEGLVREAGDLGVFAVDVPEALGGLGATKKTAMLVAEKIGLGGSFAPAVLVQTGIGGLPIIYFGTEEQRARWVEGIVTGGVLTAYGLTEAGRMLLPKAEGLLDQSADIRLSLANLAQQVSGGQMSNPAAA